MKIEQLHQLYLKSQGVTTDTRKIKSGQLFFALKGENFNGNTFASKALEDGASFAIIDEGESFQGKKYILVDNVLETLQNLATYHRRYLNIPILAITGSNGKTTTKELIHIVLLKKYNTTATAGNLNNHIGVPLTLLSMNEHTEFGIVEMGANHHQEIAKLCEIALPDFGYITNFGKAHLEGFGSLEGVIKAKSEMYDHIKAYKKLLFLNIDDPVQKKHIEYSNTYTFGTSELADISISYPEATDTARVVADGIMYKSSLYGSYNAVNIAAAVCIGKYFNVSTTAIKEAVLSYIPINNRSQIINIGNTTILMDAYNANPTSMKATLDSFRNSPAALKAVILGDMFELGPASAMEHQFIASHLAELKFDQNFLVGSNFNKVNSDVNAIHTYGTFQELSEALKQFDFTDYHILIKGSRGMALERVLEVLKQTISQE